VVLLAGIRLFFARDHERVAPAPLSP